MAIKKTIHPGSGFFISLEGPEGAGKSTHIRLLEAHLVSLGFDVVLTREPGGTPLAESIRMIVKHHAGPEIMEPLTELLLLEAARAQHVAQVIAPALAAGKVVISDRFMDSTSAYQGFGRGMDLAWIERLNLAATGGIVPDLTFILDLPVEEGFRRTRGRTPEAATDDRFESQTFAFHRKVRDGFLRLAAEAPARFRVIDVRSPAEETQRRIQECLHAFI